MKKRHRLSALAFGFAVSVLLAACAQAPSLPGVPEVVITPLHRGASLFADHCAVCHGRTGAGDGPGYPWLFPAPRDFSAGVFRLVSTTNGVPTEEDLKRTLRRGMPGSAMPSWAWMSDEDLTEVARHVRQLALAGLARRIQLDEIASGGPAVPAEALSRARELLRPGPVHPPLGKVERDPATLERGGEIYLSRCSSCHAADGAGLAPPRYNADGSLNWARDFTAGFLKGGASAEALSWRIRCGIPGTAMGSVELEDPADLRALVAYVQRLIPAGAESRLVQSRGVLSVERLLGELPTDPADEAWEDERELEIVLAPLSWSERSILSARLAAFHDGERLSLRVRWQDASGEPRIFSELDSVDGVALQLSSDPEPVLFGMGARNHPTDLWHWKALRLSDIAGSLDLFERRPHTVGEPFRSEARTDVPVYRRELGLPTTSREADSLRAEGRPDLLRQAEHSPLVVQPRWHQGWWEVVFSRRLRPAESKEIVLLPGARAQFSLAVWNGAAGDRKGQKSISIWHGLLLEP